ncbi:hypothetical protein BKA62DRAFT_677274 [Auriculariales sp. MPI-PUGE-AT-0066]|nr:hypothetical protein BKA62DRAFT_677274 [Auriculariales sp. MPI-PUGE-AT-0066]
MSASFYGRPLNIKDETFDVELPSEADDDCWDIENPGYPLRETLLHRELKLMLILGISTQTIYSINRSRLLMGFVGTDWEQRITSKIDNMLDEWAAAVPIHLRWDPDSVDLTRFLQSSFLYARYHGLKIHAHNPFMRTTARDLSHAAPSSRTATDRLSSLAICTAAAVECSEILLAVIERYPRSFRQPGWADPIFVSGLVLLVNLFGFKSSLGDSKMQQYAKYVEACLDALKVASEDYPVAEPRL